MHPRAVYPSKRDLWIVLLLWFGVAVSLWGVFVLWWHPVAAWLRWGMSALLLAEVGLLFWLLYGTRYVLEGESLRIFCGPFRWTVSLEAIDEVKRSRNPLSAPACSLDRLHIQYRGSVLGTLVSPQEREAFLQDLQARAPHLERDGEGLVRSADGSASG